MAPGSHTCGTLSYTRSGLPCVARRIQQKGGRVSSKAESETAWQRPPRSPGSFAAGEAGHGAATRRSHTEKPTRGGAEGCRQQPRATSQLCEQAVSEAVPAVRASPSKYVREPGRDPTWGQGTPQDRPLSRAAPESLSLKPLTSGEISYAALDN